MPQRYARAGDDSPSCRGQGGGFAVLLGASGEKEWRFLARIVGKLGAGCCVLATHVCPQVFSAWTAPVPFFGKNLWRAARGGCVTEGQHPPKPMSWAPPREEWTPPTHTWHPTADPGYNTQLTVVLPFYGNQFRCSSWVYFPP